jgi:hypothetical protein
LSLVLDGGRQSVPGFDARPEGTPGDGAADVLADPPTTGPDEAETSPGVPTLRAILGTPDSPPGPAPEASDVLPAVSPEGREDLVIISPPVIEFPAMSTLVINPSVMAGPSWQLSVMITPRPGVGVPPHLSARPAVSPAYPSNVGHNPGQVLSYEDDPYGEPEERVGTAYTKPLSRILGTFFLFLILGLIFLKGRRDVGSR